MQIITLTSEHRSKLLEMCKVLFLEYDMHQFSNSFSIPQELGFVVMFNFSKKINAPDIIIHWYELCIEHLLLKLNLKYYNYNRWCIEEGKIHLIDYLYKEFINKFNV